LLRNDGDYRDLFTTRSTELTTRLGSLYGVPVAPRNGVFDAWSSYEFPSSSGQAGILTQASFVALHSQPGRSSPTLRGRALREILLCPKVPAPPGNVDFKLVQDMSNALYKTARQRLTAHATEPTCKGCHKLTDPMGLGLESFDTVGGFRTTENGALIDTSGELDGVKYTDATGLGQALHDNPKAAACLVKRVYEYSVGHSTNKQEDAWLVNTLDRQFADGGYRFRALVRALATSETFRTVSAPPPANSPTVVAAAQR